MRMGNRSPNVSKDWREEFRVGIGIGTEGWGGGDGGD
jgi:hypothetical protein